MRSFFSSTFQRVRKRNDNLVVLSCSVYWPPSIERVRRKVSEAKATSDFRSIPRHSASPSRRRWRPPPCLRPRFDPPAVDIYIYIHIYTRLSWWFRNIFLPLSRVNDHTWETNVRSNNVPHICVDVWMYMYVCDALFNDSMSVKAPLTVQKHRANFRT